MTEEYLKTYEDKLKHLSESEKKLRNIYLRRLTVGDVCGPRLGITSIDKPWLKHYSENALKVELPEKTLYEYMMENNKNHKDEIALRYFDTTVTFGELDENIDRTVKSLKKLGVKKGDMVAVIMANTPEAIYTIYAINKMGAIASMIHPLSAPNQIKAYLNEHDDKRGISKPKVVIALDSTVKNIKKIVKDTEVKKVVVASPADSMKGAMKFLYNIFKKEVRFYDKKFISYKTFLDLSNNDYTAVLPELYEKDRVAVIMHTGGTTGDPKGAMLSDDNFNTMVAQFFKSEDNFERGDRLLTVMPVFHGFGLCSSIHLPLHVGVSCILVPKLDKKNLHKLILEERPNHIIGVPTLYKALINNENLKDSNLSFLKYVVSGGDLVKDSLECQINKWLKDHDSKAKLCKGYGLTEMVAGATFACNEYNGPYTIGIPMVFTDLKIVKPGTNEETKNNEAGEMLFSGPSVMLGYLSNDKESKEALKDGWLHTGDLAKWNDGLLYFSQRKGDMIISSGVNVYPSQIEGVIENHSAIQTCVVVGVDHPYKGQVPKAYIMLKSGIDEKKKDRIKKELQLLCDKELDRYSHPASYEFVKEFPQTLLGKVARNQVGKARIKTLKNK